MYQIPTKTIDSKGRQEMNTTGAGEGYFITNGYAVPITWEKRTRSSQTIYRLYSGEEIKVNDGILKFNQQERNGPLNR